MLFEMDMPIQGSLSETPGNEEHIVRKGFISAATVGRNMELNSGNIIAEGCIKALNILKEDTNQAVRISQLLALEHLVAQLRINLTVSSDVPVPEKNTEELTPPVRPQLRESPETYSLSTPAKNSLQPKET